MCEVIGSSKVRKPEVSSRKRKAEESSMDSKRPCRSLKKKKELDHEVYKWYPK